MFWTPAFAGVTLQETFYEIIKSIALFSPQTNIKSVSKGLPQYVPSSLQVITVDKISIIG